MSISLTWDGREQARQEAGLPFRGAISLYENTTASPLEQAYWQSSDHHLLISDNLAALRLFRDVGLKFQFIYVDPPYNTGRNLSFCDIHRATPATASGSESWLSMMYPRLILAREILAENGILFISIDDREHASLTMLLFEIFGRENHVGTLKWRKKRKPSFLDKHLGSVIEYILVFARNGNRLERLLGEPTLETTRPVLNAANSVCERILRAGTPARCRDGRYPAGVRTNRTLTIEFCNDFRIEKGRLANDVTVKGRFRISQDLLDKTVFLTHRLGLRRVVEPSERQRKHASDNCTQDWPTNEDGEREIRSIFGSRVFEYAKPAGLLVRLLNMCQFSSDKEVRCLDFFAGSGTLAEAVLQLNQARSDTPYRFFLVQSRENVVGASATQFPTVADIALARVTHALNHHNAGENSVRLPLRLTEIDRGEVAGSKSDSEKKRLG